MLPPELMTQAERIVLAMQQEAARYTSAAKIELAAVQFVCVTDPVNQQPGYEGIWRNERAARCGSFNLNSDGSFYAEFDLFCPHPHDVRWFVEMVTAWGRGESLRCETTLIPSL
ncbi:MAG: hypothetical protein HY849_01115 [Nitrosomonadales bacterium]|nr:hypothetical protein [Nitrosomonadales bacterium]